MNIHSKSQNTCDRLRSRHHQMTIMMCHHHHHWAGPLKIMGLVKKTFSHPAFAFSRFI